MKAGGLFKKVVIYEYQPFESYCNDHGPLPSSYSIWCTSHAFKSHNQLCYKTTFLPAHSGRHVRINPTRVYLRPPVPFFFSFSHFSSSPSTFLTMRIPTPTRHPYLMPLDVTPEPPSGKPRVTACDAASTSQSGSTTPPSRPPPHHRQPHQHTHAHLAQAHAFARKSHPSLLTGSVHSLAHREADAALLSLHLQRNITEARAIAFYTSRRRLLRTHSFTCALRRTRRLLSSFHALYDMIHCLGEPHCACKASSCASARQCSSRALRPAHFLPGVNGGASSLADGLVDRGERRDDEDADKVTLLRQLHSLEAKLSASRDRALTASSTTTVAQDVFVLLSIFLGLSTTPPRLAGELRHGRWPSRTKSSRHAFPRRASAPSVVGGAGRRQKVCDLDFDADAVVQDETVVRDTDCRRSVCRASTDGWRGKRTSLGKTWAPLPGDDPLLWPVDLVVCEVSRRV